MTNYKQDLLVQLTDDLNNILEDLHYKSHNIFVNEVQTL